MGWFSKIFKLSGLKDSEEHSHANYGGDPNGYEPTSSGVISSTTPCHSLLLSLQTCMIEMGMQAVFTLNGFC